MQNKPNILFFFTDDQRFDTIHALDNEEIITPNLDKLVENGTVFTQGHIPCGTSGAVCMPSRGMLHSGRTLFHLEGEGQNIPKEHVTLGETLRKYQYRTFGTGKWHNGTDSYSRSFTDGAEIMFGGMADHWNVPVCEFDPSGKYDNKAKYIIDPFSQNNCIQRHIDHMHFGKHSSELFCDAAIDFINNYQDNQPFFSYISFMAPHDPRTMPERFLEMYDENKLTLPKNFKNEHEFNFGIRIERDETLAPYPRTKAVVKRHLAEYYAMITHLDYEIGRVLEALQQNGYADNTIIIFAGDNGLSLGQHGLFGKQNNYEHSIRVPLMFSGPGIPKNEKRETYAYLLDIYPTICDMLDIPIPASVEGQSLLPSIQDNSVHNRETLYFAFTHLIRSVKNEQYKLIEYRTDDFKKTQLFDIKNDPWEMNNLSEKIEYTEVIEQLRNELYKYRDEWDDTKHPLGEKYWAKY